MTELLRAFSLDELQKRKSEKWRGFASDVLPLPVAEMDFPLAEPIRAALVDLIDRSDTGYLGSIPELAENFATFSMKRWGWSVVPENLKIATDVGVAVVEILRTLIKDGDRVLINSPVYENIYNWLNEVRATTVDAPLKKGAAVSEMLYALDFEGIEKEYAQGIKVHFLCSPHNPVGIVFTKNELSTLADLAKKYGVIIISDEIHGPLTFAESAYTPFLAASETAREVGISVTSASKAWNLAGLKCAFMVAQSPEIKARIDQMPMAVHYRASLFGAVASAAAFKDGTAWLDQLLATLDENRKLVKKLIDSQIPAIKYRIPNFGYLAWLDLTDLNLGEDPCATLLTRGKVAVRPGLIYGSQSDQFVRLNYGTSPEIITEAFHRILKSI